MKDFSNHLHKPQRLAVLPVPLSHGVRIQTSNASLTKMSSYIISSLAPCMVTTIKTKKLQTGKMWGLYHLLCTSSEYKQWWIAFIMVTNDTDSTTANHPLLYQLITQPLMKDLFKTYHPIPGSNACSHSSTMSHLH